MPDTLRVRYIGRLALVTLLKPISTTTLCRYIGHEHTANAADLVCYMKAARKLEDRATKYVAARKATTRALLQEVSSAKAAPQPGRDGALRQNRARAATARLQPLQGARG